MTKIYTYLCALLILLWAGPSLAQDLQVQNPNTFLNTMEDVAMHESGTGMAIGSAGLILRTTNFGESWTILDESLQNTRRIAAIPGSDGDDFLLLSSNEIRLTTDAGDTWTVGTLPGPVEGGYLRFRSLPESGAFYVGNPGSILKSTDGGINWEDVTPDLGDEEIHSISFVSANQGWYATKTGGVYQTQDGGQTWTAQDVATFSERAIVSFMDENIGYAAVFRDLYKTTDGGATWTLRLANAFGSHMDQVEIIDEDRIAFSQGALIVYATDNGGQTVDRFTALPYGYNHQYLTALPDGRVWLACSYGSIAYSDDGGFNYIDQIPAVKHYLSDISMLDENVGWAGGRGAAVRTQNGGGEWQPVELPPNTVQPDELTTVMLMKPASFTSALIGTDHAVYETTDGGENWSTLLSANDDEQFRIYASQGEHLWTLSSDPLIYHSSDNGANWTSTPYEGTPFLPYFMEFVNADLGFMGGTSGTLLKTTDGGESWTQIPNFTTSHLESIFFINENEGWLVPQSFADLVYHTTDGGDTWTELPHGFTSFWNKFYAVSEQELYLFGGSSAQGTAIYSTDGGQNWELLFNSYVTAYQDVARVDVANGFYFWVCGAAGYIARADFIETGVNNISYERLSFYPNPSNGQVQLDLLGEELSEATIRVYNQQGQTLKTEAASRYLDLSNLPVGLYNVLIDTDEKVYHSQIIVH